MKNVLIVTESGSIAEKLKELLQTYDYSAEISQAEILMDAGEEFDFTIFDTLVYCGKNTDYVQKAFDRAKYHGYGKAVLVSNALAYFNRAMPDKKLAEKHKYIADCVATEKIAIGFHNEMNVSAVEVPFIENEFPKEFVTTSGLVGFDCKRFYFATDGGSPVITAENAAKAIYAVLLNGENGFVYPVCDDSRKYKDILKDKVGESQKIFEYPVEFAWLTALLQKKKLNTAGIVPEFNLKSLYKELLVTNLFYDSTAVKTALKFADLGFDSSDTSEETK